VHPSLVTGIDPSQTAIDTAQPLSDAVEVDNLEFKVADVFSLPFDDETFDVVYTHQVLIHLPFDRLSAAMEEMKRVCQIGGIFTPREGLPDINGRLTFPPDPLRDLTIHIIVARMLKQGAIDQQAGYIAGIARDLGLEEVSKRTTLDTYISREEREEYGDQWAKRSQEEAFRKYAVKEDLATERELDDMPSAWREWTEMEDGWAMGAEMEYVFRK
jgi:ubiquinone/menaquinone biosynthesis C-methylase UbiE